jgi:sugar-specific transcriptional regulator TrmB
MYKDIMNLLGRLGLKDRESRVYLACLKYKDGLFVYEIAKETRITRSTVDFIVKRLLQRGFLNKVKVGRRLRYFAQDPEAVLFRQKQLVEELEQVAPILSGLGGQRKDMDIFYFEGAHGFRQVQNDILLNLKFAEGEKKRLLGFYSGLDYLKIFPDAHKAFISRRIKMGVWGYAIATRSSAGKAEWSNDPKYLRQFKFVSEEDFPFRMIVEIYADNVMLYSPVKPVGGVVIRNDKIADSMRALFNLVWTLLPES